MSAAIVVFTGPSLAPRDAAELLPEADIEGPVRRGDLRAAREQGAQLAVVIDGVFFQQPALPPREVIDVARDGMRVVGASSMGALRAAECWPVPGVRGVGLVYALFRRGLLDSDDEVAVTMTGGDAEAASVALVNVRVAAARGVRAERLAPPDADRIVDAARRLFYPERTWPRILAEAQVAVDREARAWLEQVDVKRTDARTALRRIAREQSTNPVGAVAPRAPLPPPVRERLHLVAPASPSPAIQEDLARWLAATGRCRRHAPLSATRDPQALWTLLAEAGELDAELWRMRAVREAAAEAQAAGLKPAGIDRHLAATELAARHGAASWEALRTQPPADVPESLLEAAFTQLAAAKRVRRERFACGAERDRPHTPPATG